METETTRMNTKRYSRSTRNHEKCGQTIELPIYSPKTIEVRELDPQPMKS